MGLFGWKLWFTPGDGCDRCGSKASDLASPGFLSGQLWCVRCLRETGRLR